MTRYPNEEELHPICKARRLRNELGEAVDAKKWKRSHNLAKDLIKQIDLCLIDPSPQLDGLFTIGTMWYLRAPDKSKNMIDRFNHKLNTEQRKLLK